MKVCSNPLGGHSIRVEEQRKIPFSVQLWLFISMDVISRSHAFESQSIPHPFSFVSFVRLLCFNLFNMSSSSSSSCSSSPLKSSRVSLDLRRTFTRKKNQVTFFFCKDLPLNGEHIFHRSLEPFLSQSKFVPQKIVSIFQFAFNRILHKALSTLFQSNQNPFEGCSFTQLETFLTEIKQKQLPLQTSTLLQHTFDEFNVLKAIHSYLDNKEYDELELKLELESELELINFSSSFSSSVTPYISSAPFPGEKETAEQKKEDLSGYFLGQLCRYNLFEFIHSPKYRLYKCSTFELKTKCSSSSVFRSKGAQLLKDVQCTSTGLKVCDNPFNVCIRLDHHMKLLRKTTVQDYLDLGNSLRQKLSPFWQRISKSAKDLSVNLQKGKTRKDVITPSHFHIDRGNLNLLRFFLTSQLNKVRASLRMETLPPPLFEDSDQETEADESD